MAALTRLMPRVLAAVDASERNAPTLADLTHAFSITRDQVASMSSELDTLVARRDELETAIVHHVQALGLCHHSVGRK